MSLLPTSFAPASAEDGRQLLERLAARFEGRVRRSPAARLRRIYLDTFDWRVWRAAGVLAFDDAPASGVLRWLGQDGRTRRTATVDRLPSFAWELPAGPWRDELGPVLDVRRLLPVARLELERERLELLDDERKIVARVDLTGGEVRAAAAAAPRPLPWRLVVRPLRGYEAIAGTLRAAIAEDTPQAEPGGELRLALDVLGRDPAEYGGKLRVRLSPSMNAGEATCRIMGELLHAVRANEPGLREDLDPEFLHDFRVAVRRARTCLGQLRSTVPRRDGRRLRDDLAWLGRATGESRDLDVWLLQLRHHHASLPATSRDGLIPLRDHLRARRLDARAELLAALDSPRYPKLLARWDRLASSACDPSDASDAARPVGVVAAGRIARRVERMFECGRAIDDETPDEALHALRIDGKKLRYLFEFYRELLERKSLTRVVDRLKQLQDTLGEFNDLAVQRETLRRFAGELAAAGMRDPAPLLTIGGLIARLEATAVERRAEFSARFEQFAAPKNLERIERLLARLTSARSDR